MNKIEIIHKLADDFVSKTNTFSLSKSFLFSLMRFLNKTITEQQIEAWFQKNSNSLKPLLDDLNTIKWEAGPDRIGGDLARGGKLLEFIFMKKTLPEDELQYYDIKHSYFLQSEGTIPALYFYIAHYDPGPARFKKVDPKIAAHNGFLLVALQKMFNPVIDDNFMIRFQDFVQANKNKIDKIRAMFMSQPVLLGKGADGVAFSIGPSLVLKIFRETDAFNQAKEAIDRLYSSPILAKTEAMIYDVDMLGIWKVKHALTGWQDQPIYYYIMEKMKPVQSLSEDTKKYLNILQTKIISWINSNRDEIKVLRNKINKNKDKKEQINAHREVISYIIELVERIKQDLDLNIIDAINHSIPDLKPYWLDNYIEEILMKYLTYRIDLHLGNLGLTNYGDLRYFDAGHKKHETSMMYEDRLY